MKINEEEKDRCIDERIVEVKKTIEARVGEEGFQTVLIGVLACFIVWLEDCGGKFDRKDEKGDDAANHSTAIL